MCMHVFAYTYCMLLKQWVFKVGLRGRTPFSWPARIHRDTRAAGRCVACHKPCASRREKGNCEDCGWYRICSLCIATCRKELIIHSPKTAAIKEGVKEVLEACSKEQNKERFSRFSLELLINARALRPPPYLSVERDCGLLVGSWEHRDCPLHRKILSSGYMLQSCYQGAIVYV